LASRNATAQQTPATPTPISLTTLGSAYSQDFNTLGNSESVHNLTALPVGWVLSESGPNADGAYRGGNGATNTGRYW
jgi:trimeric autotransporter adhesin